MTKKYIGVSGVARSGKNLFCDIAIKQLSQKGVKAKQYALAYYLKKDCEEFIKTKLGLDVFTEKTDDKTIFREMLVWYGGVKRKQTEGAYWTSMLQKDIETDDNEVIFVSDIRYDQYPKDEVYWIKEVLGGYLVHVSKYTYNDWDERVFTEPPNEHEKLNDPLVKLKSDYLLQWKQSDIKDGLIIDNAYLNLCVKDVLKSLLD